MDEYVRHMVQARAASPAAMLASPIYRRFFAAAPGLKELMVLGKIMVLEEARKRLSREPLWDLVVVDAPATGHGLAYLKVPLAASRAVPVGPDRPQRAPHPRDAAGPRRHGARGGRGPEEMAVVEAVEFHRAARGRRRDRAAGVVLNGCHERRFSDEDEAEVLRLATVGRERASSSPACRSRPRVRAARRQIRRRKLTRFYRDRLRRSLDTPLVSLPFLFRETLGARRAAHARRRARGRLMAPRRSPAAALEPALATRRVLRDLRLRRRRQDDGGGGARAARRARRPARARLHDRPLAPARHEPRQGPALGPAARDRPARRSRPRAAGRSSRWCST